MIPPVADSIFRREEDREHSGGYVGVCGIFRARRAIRVVVIQLEGQPFSASFEAAEVMLLVRVRAFVELGVTLHLENCLRLNVERQARDALAHNNSPSDERRSEVVVENADASSSSF